MKRKSTLTKRLTKLSAELSTARAIGQTGPENLARMRAQWDESTPAFRARFPIIGRFIERHENAQIEASAPEAWLYSELFEKCATPPMLAWRESGAASRQHLEQMSDTELDLLNQLAIDYYSPDEPPPRPT